MFAQPPGVRVQRPPSRRRLARGRRRKRPTRSATPSVRRGRPPSRRSPNRGSRWPGCTDEIVEPVRPALRVFLVAVAVVLLIVCANVANLLLARGRERVRGSWRCGWRSARVVPGWSGRSLPNAWCCRVVGGTLGAALGAAGVQTGQDARHHRCAGRLPSQLRRRPAAAHQRSPRRCERRADRVRSVARRQHRLRPASGAAPVARESSAGDGRARQRRQSRRETRTRTVLVVSSAGAGHRAAGRRRHCSSTAS